MGFFRIDVVAAKHDIENLFAGMAKQRGVAALPDNPNQFEQIDNW